MFGQLFAAGGGATSIESSIKLRMYRKEPSGYRVTRGFFFVHCPRNEHLSEPSSGAPVGVLGNQQPNQSDTCSTRVSWSGEPVYCQWKSLSNVGCLLLTRMPISRNSRGTNAVADTDVSGGLDCCQAIWVLFNDLNCFAERC
jgi:hypothetical protein